MKRQYWTLLSNSAHYEAKDFASTVRRLEERGFAGLEMPQAYGPPFIPLAAAAMVTKRMQLASGIAMGLTRSPFETAMATIDLDRLSEGRFILGLGTGPEHFTSGYFGMPYDKPVSRLREVVQVLRHVEDGARSGTMKSWRGEFYKLDFPGYEPTLPPYRERVPVWIAALRSRMCELAGEVGDGLIGHPLWSVEWALGEAQKALAVGAARSGRDPGKIHFKAWVPISIDRNSKVAVDAAKPQVAYYAGFAQYDDYFAAHGFANEARKLQEAARSMDPLHAVHLVPDEMARTFVACGSPDEVSERVELLWQRANSMLLYIPGWGLTPEQLEQRTALMEETFPNT